MENQNKTMTGNLDAFSIKKRYYFSMLSLLPLVWCFGLVYLVFHRSIEIFIGASLTQLILYGVINYIGSCLIYKPIDQFLAADATQVGSNDQQHSWFAKRVNSLNLYSTLWAFLLGFFYVLLSILPILFFPALISSDVFDIKKSP